MVGRTLITIIIGLAAVFFGIVFVGGLVGTPNQVLVPTNNDQSMPTKAAQNLELLEAEIQEDGFLRSVVGIVKNNTRRQYKYAQIEINLYDKAGTQVGSTMANINNLESGGQWKFKALFAEKDAVRFNVKSITGF